MGEIEQGVYTTLKALGIDAPRTALETMAVATAHALDNLTEEKNRASLNRELRLTLEAVADQPTPTHDAVKDMEDRY
jgi:hypothetical protein